jgi:hypothetical protein
MMEVHKVKFIVPKQFTLTPTLSLQERGGMVPAEIFLDFSRRGRVMIDDEL